MTAFMWNMLATFGKFFLQEQGAFLPKVYDRWVVKKNQGLKKKMEVQPECVAVSSLWSE